MSFTLWLTGRPRAGKTTLGRMLAAELALRLGQAGGQVRHLDAGELRASFLADLGFSPVERRAAALRLAWVARTLNEHGVACVVGQIAPYAGLREELRAALPGYVEAYLDCPLETAMNRDAEGLYARALAGGLGPFTGLDDPYEEPLTPHLVLPTSRQSPAESLAQALAWLEAAALLPPGPTAEPGPYTPEEERIIEQRLKDLGYL
jgi:adenylylsulfate kinase